MKIRVATPARLFWLFVTLHLVAWTIIPTLTSPNAPLDVIEGYAWGREWLLGTYKHPPMQAWWLGMLAHLTGRAPWAHFLASQIAVVISFWAVWQTGRRMFSEHTALLGALLLEGVVYYNFTSPEFNPNLLQLPFWALIGLFFHRAIKDNRMADWLLLGIWSAGGLYTKYSTLLVLATLVLLALIRPEGRRRLTSPGPYLAFGVASLLFLPHLVWLFDHDFLPFTYALDRMQADPHAGFLFSYVREPAFYILSQLLAMLPATLLFFAFFDCHAQPEDKRLRSFDRDFLDFITFGPFVITLVLAMFVRVKLHDMWAMPFWNFIGLWAISRFKAEFSPQSKRHFTYSWIVVFTAALVGHAGSTMLAPYIVRHALRVQFPGRSVTEQMDAAWGERFREPLRYVIGDVWMAGNVAYYSPEWPHVFIGADAKISTWIAPEDVTQSGGLLVWCLQNCSYKNRKEMQPAFVDRFPQAEIQPPITLPRQTDADLPPAIVGWAILPPAGPAQD